MLRTRIMSATGVKSTDASTWIAVKEGRMGRRIQPAQGPAYDLPGCCPCSGDALDVSFITYTSSAPQGYTIGFILSWNTIQGASSYTVTVDTSDNFIVEYPSLTTANVYINWISSDPEPIYNFTVTANACDAVGNVEQAPCFLAGSMVQMADGSQKAIEDVAVGDVVLGAFGEANPVFALHRPLLGSAHMNLINGEHSTTAHHPHVSVDRGFYCSEPATVENATYGQEHEVIDGTGVVKRFLHGLKKGRVQRLDLGIVLKTVEGGRSVTSLETYNLPPETQLYNLVTGGSHTYHVDGYAVTGWPREDDWDYDNWCPKIEECRA